MPENLENSAVTTVLEKVSFPLNPKERQCPTMFKLLHSCTHLTHQQSNVQNSQSHASTVHEQLTFRYSSWIQKGRGTRDQILNICQIIKKEREFQKINIYFCFTDYVKAFDCVDNNKLWKILQDGNTRPPDLPLEKFVSRSGSNSQKWTWNKILVPNRERSMSRLYIVTLLI